MKNGVDLSELVKTWDDETLEAGIVKAERIVKSYQDEREYLSDDQINFGNRMDYNASIYSAELRRRKALGLKII